MPTSVEAALILIVLAGPGFISSRMLNRLVPYLTPSPFQETTQAVILSALMVPVWLLAARPLLASRNEFLKIWQQQQLASHLPWWAICMPIAVFVLVYFVVAPLLAVSWAIVIRRAPHIRLALGLLQWAGVRARYDEGPEVWDEVFGHQDTQRWVRVVFRDGTALEGVVTGAGVSPAARQVYLRGLEGVANSLARLDAQGNVLEDLSAKGAEGVWIDIGGDVRVVEVYRP